MQVEPRGPETSEINGGGNTDKFRIKIWDKNNGDTIVYDNAPGSDDIDQSQGTPLTPDNGNGSIVIPVWSKYWNVVNRQSRESRSEVHPRLYPCGTEETDGQREY